MLALDAPAVAIAWSWAIADAAGASFTLREAAVVGLATASVYLLDRRLDVPAISAPRTATRRHAWTAAHASVVTTVAAATATGVLALGLSWREIAWGGMVAAAAGLLLLPPLRRARDGARDGSDGTARSGFPSASERLSPLRPLAVGAVFAAGVALPAVDGALATVAPAAGMLAAVAALNVALIATWEVALDDGSGQTARARRRASRTDAARVGVALALAAAAWAARPWLTELGGPLALAAVLLAALELVGARWPAELRHLAADAALLVALLPVAGA